MRHKKYLLTSMVAFGFSLLRSFSFIPLSPHLYTYIHLVNIIHESLHIYHNRALFEKGKRGRKASTRWLNFPNIAYDQPSQRRARPHIGHWLRGYASFNRR